LRLLLAPLRNTFRREEGLAAVEGGMADVAAGDFEPMRIFALLFLATSIAAGQTPLHQRLAEIAKQARGNVYVSCSLPGVELDCDLDSHGHPPMQSTFKFPLALAVLHAVELGKLQLDQPVRFLKSDRSVTFSPLQDEFPNAGT